MKFLTGVLFLSLLVCVLGRVTCSAATLRVGQPGTPCPHAQFPTIGAAVFAAAPNDVIEICPAQYPEQLQIAKPLTLRGIEVDGVKRVLLKPEMTDWKGLPTEAVITVLYTSGVTIDNLSLDASLNTVSGCSPGLAGVHFYSASGTVKNSAIYGAKLTNPVGCTALPFGNGFGVRVDSATPGSFHVLVDGNSIHNFTANGVQVTGAGVTAEVSSNNIAGVGPSAGIFQFGVFLVNGAAGYIHNNTIQEGLCGGLAILDCIAQRSEGVTLRNIGDGTVVDHNIIVNAQSGIFINGANRLTVTNNQISNIDAMSGLDIQGTASGFFTNSLIAGNSISHVKPINSSASNDEEGCGINEYSGTGTFSGNVISGNKVNDAYCGVAHVTADFVAAGAYMNTLYTELNSDLYPNVFPPPREP